MTNTQQMALEPTTDQPHEEIQLTELRPVEQSRINKGIDDKDNDATDGLRALRSFSRRPIDEFEEFGTSFSKKRKNERWNHIKSINEFEFNQEDEDCAKKRNISVSQIVINGDKCNDGQIYLDQYEEDEDDEYCGINGDFEYLDERSTDEIYVYQQRDSCSSPEAEKPQSIPEKPKKTYDTNEVTEKIQKSKPQQIKIPRPRGRPRKKKNIRKKEVETSAKIKVNESSINPTDNAEKELQSKINDIIEANYLLEQENNNIIDNGKSHCGLNESSKDKTTEETSKKYCCDICKTCFKGSGGLRNHYKVVHATGPLFKCDECGKEFPLKERLKLHVRTHTGFKPYKCSECDKTFARGGQLVQHRRTHSQIKPYSCDLCSGTFTCAANLALHVKRHNGQKDHKCDICGRGFVRRDALKKHLECLHRDVKSFLCVICNKTFKGHLPQHMRTHAQDRPHGCATCGQRFAQKSQLTVHQRTHSGQRPFRCLVCWQAFAHSTALKLHTRRHTGERPFKCTECNAGFTQLPHWKKHMKCIHGRSEPYSCRKCRSFFRIKNDLEAHEKDCQVELFNDSTSSSDPGNSGDANDGSSTTAVPRYVNMSIEKMRLLLAVLLKRISEPKRLDELGFGKRLIDQVLIDSLISAGKEVVKVNGITPEFDALRKNLAVFLEWTVPKEHWENFRKMNKTPEEVLETLTAT